MCRKGRAVQLQESLHHLKWWQGWEKQQSDLHINAPTKNCNTLTLNLSGSLELKCDDHKIKMMLIAL